MPARADGSMRRDILSAYVASASRIGSWVIVSALVYRRSPEAFAMLALGRGALGIVNHSPLGPLPAMIQAFASLPALRGTPERESEGKGGAFVPVTPTTPSIAPPSASAALGPAPLAYLTPETARRDAVRQLERLKS